MNSGGLRGCPLSTNTNAGAGDKTLNYVCNPPLFIAFVTARLYFLIKGSVFRLLSTVSLCWLGTLGITIGSLGVG